MGGQDGCAVEQDKVGRGTYGVRTDGSVMSLLTTTLYSHRGK